jgi:HD-like signal output (HDOD) protein
MTDILYGVDAWIEYLKDRALPVRNSVLRRLQRQLKDENIALQKIKNTIKSDPVLCLHVVRKASALHLQKDSQVTGIDHAISSLGLNHIESLLGETTALKLNPSSVAQKMYFRSIAISHHAATQARSWLLQRRATYLDEAYLASLFYGAGYWMLWQHASLHMSEIETAIRESGTEPVDAETAVLGCSVQEISKGLMAQWEISELAVTSLEHETSPDRKNLVQLHQRALGDPRISEQDLREINHLVQERFFPVKLANWLAQAANYGWHTPKTMKVIDIINDYLQGEIATTLTTLHSQCAHSAQLYHVAGTLAPAAEMLMLSSDLQINYKLSGKESALLSKNLPAIEKPAPEPIPQPASEAPPELASPTAARQRKPFKHTELPISDDYKGKNVYDQISERFLKGYHLYTEPKHILQGLIQGLNKGVGFERTALFIINPKAQQMKTALCAGFDDDHPVARFSCKLDPQGLFSKMTEKTSCIWVRQDNRQQMLKMLPENYTSWVSTQGFVLTSIFFGNKPIAIIHADHGNSETEISEFHNERLRYLCSAAGLGLKRMKKT